MGNFHVSTPAFGIQTQGWFTYIKRFERAEETLPSKGPRFCPTRQGTFPFNSSLLASKLDNRKIASRFCSTLSAVELGQGLADARWRRVVLSERPCDWIVTHYGRLTDSGSGEKSVEETIFDVKRAGLCDKRWLVSRKRTRNLFDVSQAWKRSLLTELDSSRDDSPDYWDQLVDIDISEVEV